MDSYSLPSKPAHMASSTSVNSDEAHSSTTTYGSGHVYTGPLTRQYYENHGKPPNELPRTISTPVDGPTVGSSTPSSSTHDASLSSSPSMEIISNSNQYQFKVMLLGDSGVGKCSFDCRPGRHGRLDRSLGKTCLLVRFKDGTFLAGSFIATVGIDFRNKLVTLGDKKIKLQIFDTVREPAREKTSHRDRFRSRPAKNAFVR